MAPTEGADQQAKFAVRRDKTLATTVLAVEPSLLYLIGADPTDLVKIWKCLADQFQRKTWANKLELKRKLFSMRLGERGSVHNHIQSMTEVCDELSAIGEPVNEEDRVVYLLASLPESYNVLVTALEASVEVPALAVVTERLLHEEGKMKSRWNPSSQEGHLLPDSRRNQPAIIVTKLDTLRKTAKNMQSSRVRSNQPKPRRKPKWGIQSDYYC